MKRLEVSRVVGVCGRGGGCLHLLVGVRGSSWEFVGVHVGVRLCVKRNKKLEVWVRVAYLSQGCMLMAHLQAPVCHVQGPWREPDSRFRLQHSA